MGPTTETPASPSAPNQYGEGTEVAPTRPEVDYYESADLPASPAIEWEASESVHHQKDTIWYGGLIGIGLLLAVLSIFLLKSWTFTILIIVMVASVIFLSIRQPRVLHYRLSGDGLTINEKHYSFHDFKAFGIAEDGPFYYVILLPTKRFMPSIDVYFPTEHGEQIVDILGAHIPMKTIEPDFVDELTRRLRF